MDGLTEGRIVHYVLPNGEHRPAIVVRVWRYVEADNVSTLKVPENGCCQLQIFLDGTNDRDMAPESCERGLIWATSVLYSATPEPRTWHWIEKA